MVVISLLVFLSIFYKVIGKIPQLIITRSGVKFLDLSIYLRLQAVLIRNEINLSTILVHFTDSGTPNSTKAALFASIFFVWAILYSHPST